MIAIDKIAYLSKLRHIDPVIKLMITLAVMLISMNVNSYFVSVIIIVGTSWVIAWHGDIRLRTFLKLLSIPLTFLIFGVIVLIVQRAEHPENLLIYLRISNWYYGVHIGMLRIAGMHLAKALGAISCMYFLSLTTPMTELIGALGRLKCPKLILELMELIYRFIFVLTDTANRITIAQASRLGYRNMPASFISMGILISMLFTSAYKRSERIYIALESRGYDGELCVLPVQYNKSPKFYVYGAIVIAFLLAVSMIEGRVLR